MEPGAAAAEAHGRSIGKGRCRRAAGRYRRRVSRRCGAGMVGALAGESQSARARTRALTWKAQHGRIPARSWVLMRTDWSKRTDPVAFQNYHETGQHTLRPSVDV